jgi:cytochrome c-type biogenesis protein CcmH/NrfG
VSFAALAEEYRRASRFDEAIATCRAGLERHPDYVSARVTLGRALLDTGALTAAQAEFEQVIKLAPENLAAIRGLAEIHKRLSDPFDAQSGASATAATTAAGKGTATESASSQPASAPAATETGLEGFLSAIRKLRGGLQNPDASDRS